MMADSFWFRFWFSGAWRCVLGWLVAAVLLWRLVWVT